jgi:hypothetical protein
VLLVAGAAAVLGYLLTTVLPEPARRSLEEISQGDIDKTVAGSVVEIGSSAVPGSR